MRILNFNNHTFYESYCDKNPQALIQPFISPKPTIKTNLSKASLKKYPSQKDKCITFIFNKKLDASCFFKSLLKKIARFENCDIRIIGFEESLSNDILAAIEQIASQVDRLSLENFFYCDQSSYNSEEFLNRWTDEEWVNLIKPLRSITKEGVYQDKDLAFLKDEEAYRFFLSATNSARTGLLNPFSPERKAVYKNGEMVSNLLSIIDSIASTSKIKISDSGKIFYLECGRQSESANRLLQVQFNLRETKDLVPLLESAYKNDYEQLDLYLQARSCIEWCLIEPSFMGLSSPKFKEGEETIKGLLATSLEVAFQTPCKSGKIPYYHYGTMKQYDCQEDVSPLKKDILDSIRAYFIEQLTFSLNELDALQSFKSDLSLLEDLVLSKMKEANQAGKISLFRFSKIVIDLELECFQSKLAAINEFCLFCQNTQEGLTERIKIIEELTKYPLSDELNRDIQKTLEIAKNLENAFSSFLETLKQNKHLSLQTFRWVLNDFKLQIPSINLYEEQSRQSVLDEPSSSSNEIEEVEVKEILSKEILSIGRQIEILLDNAKDEIAQIKTQPTP